MSGVWEKKDDCSERWGGGLEEERSVIAYEQFIQRENILRAWKMFVRGKWRQRAVIAFWQEQEKELMLLYHDLRSGSYRHGLYQKFVVAESKRREIAVASVRDRIVHQMIATVLEQRYAKHFYRHSYCAQRGKGVDAARAYALKAIRRLSGHCQVWVGKLDVERYFQNVDHGILFHLLARRIHDPGIMEICQGIIESFGDRGYGLPLGNLTSQWFANIYLNELDWFAKQTLRIPYYLRYNDDMIIIGISRQKLAGWISALRHFAAGRLRLAIPSKKTSLVGLPQAVDMLGLATNGQRIWIRSATVRRAYANARKKASTVEPELLDTFSAYSGCGINQPFSVVDCIDAYA